MFTIITAIDTVKVFHSLADALTFCTMSFEICGFVPVIKDANLHAVGYAFDANGIAYSTNMTYTHSSLDTYFARQAM